jgi:hypothetical protein
MALTEYRISKIKVQMHDYRELHAAAVEASKAARLAAGKAPIPGRITDDQARKTFLDQGNVMKAKAFNELTDWKKQLNQAQVAAPSEEQLRTIQAFKLRSPKTMTREEYQAAAQAVADSVSSNFSAYATISSLASENGAHLAPHPLESEIKAYGDAEHNLRSYFNPSVDVDGNGPTAALEALTGMVLDELKGE